MLVFQGVNPLRKDQSCRPEVPWFRDRGSQLGGCPALNELKKRQGTGPSAPPLRLTKTQHKDVEWGANGRPGRLGSGRGLRRPSFKIGRTGRNDGTKGFGSSKHQRDASRSPVTSLEQTDKNKNLNMGKKKYGNMTLRK